MRKKAKIIKILVIYLFEFFQNTYKIFISTLCVYLPAGIK